MKLHKGNKEVTNIYNIVKYNDGSMQIIFTDAEGNIFDNTQEFPAHQLQDYIHLFFNTKLEENVTEDTNPLYIIDGGQE